GRVRAPLQLTAGAVEARSRVQVRSPPVKWHARAWVGISPQCRGGILMGRQSFALVAALLVGLGFASRDAAAGQIELDRIVSRVGGRIITQSDVRQARALRLVDDVSSDELTRRGLETRFLILA